jgi:hypothetical protein
MTGILTTTKTGKARIRIFMGDTEIEMRIFPNEWNARAHCFDRGYSVVRHPID